MTDALRQATSYTYDKNGNLTSETDALGNRVQYSYTPEGWLSSIAKADGTVLTFEYDKTNNLLTQNMGDEQTIHNGHNDLGMVTEVSSAEGTIVYQYNGQGYLIFVMNVNGDVTCYTYDAAGRRIETASSTLITIYGYDSVGNLLTQAISSASQIAFAYSFNKSSYITGEVCKENGTTTSTYA